MRLCIFSVIPLEASRCTCSLSRTTPSRAYYSCFSTRMALWWWTTPNKHFLWALHYFPYAETALRFPRSRWQDQHCLRQTCSCTPAPSQEVCCWHQGQAFPALVLVGRIVFLAVSEALVSALREDSTVPWRSRVVLQAFLYVVCGVLIVWLATGAQMSGPSAKSVGAIPRAEKR